MVSSFRLVFLVLLYVISVSTPADAQFNRRNALESSCTHQCIHSKVHSPGIGIYDQDERVHDYDIKFYGLDLEVDPWSTYIDGSVRIVAETVHPGIRFIVLELWDVNTVSQVVYEGQILSFVHTENILEIDLGEEKSAGSFIDLEIFYSGEPQPEGFFSGIRSAVNSFGEPVLWTLSEPHNARQWFPCKQVLNDKADSVYVFITTPAGFIAASNGLLDQVISLDNGKLRYEWKSYYPIAYYLISMAVANYQEYSFMAPLSEAPDSVFVQNFIYNNPEVLQSEQENIDMTKPLMQLLSQLWGNYPFSQEKYGHAQAPMGGAMEHQTISTMGFFGFDITAHELAHHWFGNNVTCATWSDIWINEGFATYAEYLSREFIVGEESARLWLQSVHSNVKSQPGGSVYVPVMALTDVWRIFDGRLSYRKGASILHQLRFEINNDALFFEVMEEFQAMFGNSIASGDDFRAVVDLVTGQNWEWFFDQWYYGEGYPVYEIRWWQQEGKLFIRSSQNTSATYPDFFAGTLEFRLTTSQEEQIVRVFQDEAIQEFELDIAGELLELEFDPRHFMLMEYTLWDSTNIQQPEVAELNVFPNPFTDNLTIEYPVLWHNGRFYITDLQGHVLLEGKLNLHIKQQQLASLAKGVYLLKVTSPNGEQKTVKLLKR